MGYDMNLVKPDPEVQARKQVAEAAFNAAVKARDEAAGDVRPTFDLESGSFDPVYEDPELQRLQDEVHRCYEETYAIDTNYFRANIWGMSKFREDMETLGMLNLEADRFPDWPELEEYGLTEYPDDEKDARLLTPSERKFLAAHNAVKAAEAKDVTGIPIYKLCSNDGWVVTPAEITYALKMHETADGDARRAVREGWMADDGSGYCRWDAWIQFLELARDKGEGFEVW